MDIDEASQETQFVLYELVEPGFETVLTGTKDIGECKSDEYQTYATDSHNNVTMTYSLWGFAHTKPQDWNDEIRYINEMQEKLGPLSDEVRRIRTQIASLVCCDSGVPVTIDEILNAIGTGKLSTPAFHPGCWMSQGRRSTQPYQTEAMIIIEAVLQGYLEGKTADTFVERYPYARGFIRRTYDWLGSRQQLTELQTLMLQRMLLPFAFFTKRDTDRAGVFNTCFDGQGAGKKLDKIISELAGIPPIFPLYSQAYKDHLASITDPQLQQIYRICGHIVDCISELSDCHHSSFRRIEKWIHAIGTSNLDIPTRKPHTEAERLGRLLFGYALGLDRWLQEVPMQFLLLDLGHLDLGFDPKNEILRVYAYLGEDYTPVKTWLAACLWYTLTLEPPASLYQWGRRHKQLLARANATGVSVRTWIDGLTSEQSQESAFGDWPPP